MPQKNKAATILIVEDSQTQALSLQEFLEENGLQVLHARNGHQALEMAENHLPDAIVLDIEMPGMNGFEVSANLVRTQSTKHIPIIMLTAHDSANMLQRGITFGAIDFIPKDVFAHTVLLETLRQLGLVGK